MSFNTLHRSDSRELESVPAAATATAATAAAETKNKKNVDPKLVAGVALVVLAVLGAVAAVVVTFVFAIPLMPIVLLVSIASAAVFVVGGSLIISGVLDRLKKTRTQGEEAPVDGTPTASASEEEANVLQDGTELGGQTNQTQ